MEEEEHCTQRRVSGERCREPQNGLSLLKVWGHMHLLVFVIFSQYGEAPPPRPQEVGLGHPT
jgi:hypothetical protein